MPTRRIAKTAVKPLYIEVELRQEEDIVFASIGQLLEFYFGLEIGQPKSVALESSPESTDSSFHSPLLDAFASIGYYLRRLDEAEKLILAFFYGHKKSDNQISDIINYPESRVKYLRLKQIKILDKRFRTIGMLKT
jgi:hypothetical protein